MQYTHEIMLDINAKVKLLYVPVKQFDEVLRVLHITVTEDGEAWTPDSGYTANLRVLKEDGLACFYPVTIEQDGTITAPLKEGALAKDGLALADIVFTNEAGTEILSTASFFLNVGKSGIMQHVTGTNEFQRLLELCNEAELIIGGSYGYYTPSISSAGVIHFTPSREEMPALEDVQTVSFASDGSGHVTITLGS